MELNTFISRLFSAAEAAGIAPAEAACSQSDSFRVRVRRGELEDYQVSENAAASTAESAQPARRRSPKRAFPC